MLLVGNFSCSKTLHRRFCLILSLLFTPLPPPYPSQPPNSNAKLNDMKRSGRKALGVDEDYTNLYRYAATLCKEDNLDRDERAGVEKSVASAVFRWWNYRRVCVVCVFCCRITQIVLNGRNRVFLPIVRRNFLRNTMASKACCDFRTVLAGV